MALVARTVNGEIKDAFGVPLAGETVIFIPKKTFGGGVQTIPAVKVTAVTDVDGKFSAELFTFGDDSTAPYECRLPDASEFDFNLQQGAAIDLETLRQIGLVELPSINILEDLITQIVEDQTIGFQTELDLKANLASPALTGAPTAPTPANGDNTTKLATTAFVASAISNVGDTDNDFAVLIDPTKQQQVYIGNLYLPDVEYEGFFAHALIRPTRAGYVIADGDGGGHDLLWGVDGNLTDGFTISGNIRASDGSGAFSFVTTELMRPNEPAYISIWYNKTYLVLGINGVPSAVYSFNKNRMVPTGFNNCGVALGGTDHSGYGGNLYAVGVIETKETPLPFDQETARNTAIRPYVDDFTSLKHNFCIDFRNGDFIDVGLGLNGEKHNGFLSEMSNGTGRADRNRDLTKLPVRVRDKFAFTGVSAQKTAIVGARIYDDFSGQDSHYGISKTLSLGTTRIGGKVWNTGGHWGKQFGAAFNNNSNGNIAYVTDSTPNGTVIWRRPVAAFPANVSAVFGGIFRLTDANNYSFLYIDEYGSGYLFHVVAGVATNAQSFSFGSNWTEAKVTMSGSSLEVFNGGVSKTTFTMTQNQNATSKGFQANTPILKISEFGVI